MLISKKKLSVVDYSLAALVGSFGTAIALMTLERGPWIDEFATIAWTTPGTSLREFLHLMITRDIHPILHYGMVYLLQAAHVTDIALLRSINLLGLPLVIFALAYGFRHKSINLSQALVVWVLFASSPIFFNYFAELRPYFLLYAASIATSIFWYVLMRHIDAGQNVSATMISLWGACLAIFVNLHCDLRKFALLRHHPRWDADYSAPNKIGQSPLVVAGACNRGREPSSSRTGSGPRHASRSFDAKRLAVMDQN